MSLDDDLGSFRNLPTSDPSPPRLRARLAQRRRRRVTATIIVLAVVGVAVGALAVTGDDDVTVDTAQTPMTPAIAPGQVVALTTDGRLVALDADGAESATIAELGSYVDSGGLAVAPDGNDIYLGFRTDDLSDCTGEIRRVDTADGTSDVIATDADSPALSPDGTLLAYVTLSKKDDICYRTGIVIEDLASGDELPLDAYPAPGVPDSTPPALPISWGPGPLIASVDDDGTTLLDPATNEYETLAQREELAASLPPGPLYLPTLADEHTLVVLSNCCTTDEILTRIDGDTDTPTPWATVDRAVISLAPNSDGSGLAVLMPDELTHITADGTVDTLATGYRHVATRPAPATTNQADDSTADGPACDTDDTRVHVPLVAGEPLDLLFVEHRGACGYNGDGAANFGADPKVIVVGDGDVELVADPAFEAAYSLQADTTTRGTPDVAVVPGPDGTTSIGPLTEPCMLLTVELNDPDSTGRYTARLAVADSSCTT